VQMEGDLVQYLLGVQVEVEGEHVHYFFEVQLKVDGEMEMKNLFSFEK